MPTQAKPGEKVDIKVTTNPDSYVGLMGVDQSVLLLKSGMLAEFLILPI